jgi:hypothetical protein
VLQSYASQRLLRDAGYEAEVLSYNHWIMKCPVYPTLLSRLKQYSLGEILHKGLEVAGNKLDRSLKAKLKGRYALFDDFMNLRIAHSPEITDKDLEAVGQQYDAFVCGSDQVWNPNAVRRLFMLDFPLKKGARKVSIAASVSRNALSDGEAEYMIPLINRFDAVSVREKSARKMLLQRGVNKEVEVICDPTMMLESADWDKVAAPRLIQEPYMLMYAFSECSFSRELVAYYAQRGIACYFIPYAKFSANSFDGKMPMKPLFDVGPAEFISLIKHAECVVTDSFHGSVFSIIYNRPFAVFERDSNSGKTSKNSRIYDLLDTFRLQDRLVKDGRFEPTVEKACDFAAADEVMAETRKHSAAWLLNALKG